MRAGLIAFSGLPPTIAQAESTQLEHLPRFQSILNNKLLANLLSFAVLQEATPGSLPVVQKHSLLVAALQLLHKMGSLGSLLT